jgi:type I restriction enzyme S subunit
MKLETFFEKFDQFADAPGAVGKMRELVLQLAVQGKLVEQRPKELSARECLRKANKPLVDVAPDESIEPPAGWVALPLGCLIAANTGGGTPSKQNPSYWNGPIPWASVKDVQSEKYLTSTIDSITEEGLKDSSSNLIPPNRLIVVTRMGLGKLAINTIPVAINQDLRAIEPTTALALDFAYLLFKSLKMVGSGVTVKGITVDKLHAMPVSLPPLAEQKRIVAKVDELMALCDRLEAQQQEREARHAALARASLSRFADAPTPANLHFIFHPSYAIPPADLRKSILTLAVQGKLAPQDPNDEPVEDSLARNDECRRKTASRDHRADEENQPLLSGDDRWDIAETWSWRGLADLVLFVDYRGKTPAKLSSGVRLLTAKNVRKGQINLSPEEFLSESEYHAWMTRGFPKAGDVLFTTEAPMGNAAVVELKERFALAQRVICFQSYGAIDPAFLVLQILSDQFQFILDKNGTGVTAKGIKASKLKQLPVAVPPLAEQRRIVAKVEQLMALVDELERQLAAASATAANLLSALVAELTGTPRDGKVSPSPVTSTGRRGRPRKS